MGDHEQTLSHMSELEVAVGHRTMSIYFCPVSDGILFAVEHDDQTPKDIILKLNADILIKEIQS